MTDTSLTTDHLPQNYAIRYDPIHGWPVIYAPLRAQRPFDFKQRTPLSCPENDPFVAGREDITTPETLAIREPGTPPDGPGWQVRIIPNKFPALAPHFPERNPTIHSPAGIHEVIIECPQRETHFTRLSEIQRRAVFYAVRQRLQQLSAQPELAYAMLFKNHGPAAGASLTHSHSQLMATQFVPPNIQREVDYCRQIDQQSGRDYFGDLVADEISSPLRVVEQTENFLVFCPAASRFGCEMHVVPLRAEAHFYQISQARLQEFTDVLTRSLRRLEQAAGDPDYNLVLHSAPFHQADWPGFRWHWEIYPRMAGIAGFELGAGGHVNALYPETAAQLLRNVTVE